MKTLHFDVDTKCSGGYTVCFLESLKDFNVDSHSTEDHN